MNLNQVTIPVSDMEVSISFYRQLGLQLIVDSRPRYARFVCPDGNSTFSLHQAGTVTGGGVWIYFECNALNETVAHLADAGITFESMPEDQSWLWREARLRDPDGHQLILYYAGENRVNPPWRVVDGIPANGKLL